MRRSREAERADAVAAVRRALEHRVTPGLRAVAVQVARPVIWTRFVHDAAPTPVEQDLAEAAAAEVGAELSGRWLSQVLVRHLAPGNPLVLEPGEEWAYVRPETRAQVHGPGDDRAVPPATGGGEQD